MLIVIILRKLWRVKKKYTTDDGSLDKGTVSGNATES